MRGLEEADEVFFGFVLARFLVVLFASLPLAVDGPAEGDARGRGGLNGRRFGFAGGRRSTGIMSLVGLSRASTGELSRSASRWG